MAAAPRGSASHLAQRRTSTRIREFLVFKLGSEEYGINILSIPKIRSHERPTRMAIDHVMAIGSVDERMLILLDINKLMSSADMGRISASVQ